MSKILNLIVSTYNFSLNLRIFKISYLIITTPPDLHVDMADKRG